MAFMPTGVFERLHFLMGFEDMLVNFLLEPEDMMDLCNAIGEYRFQLTKLIVDNLHPDIILSHDDWGSKQSLFISPDTWREFIKPQYERSYKYMKDHGVIIMHHADSFMEPIVEDMVDLGIDIWQGALPENDIPKLQKQLHCTDHLRYSRRLPMHTCHLLLSVEVPFLHRPLLQNIYIRFHLAVLPKNIFYNFFLFISWAVYALILTFYRISRYYKCQKHS